MYTRSQLRESIERKITNRSIHMNFGKKPYYHFGDYSTKSTANEVAKEIRELSQADIAFGGRGFLVRVSIPYFSDLNDKAKYGVYVARKEKK